MSKIKYGGLKEGRRQMTRAKCGVKIARWLTSDGKTCPSCEYKKLERKVG
jgi:hypothetical protein